MERQISVGIFRPKYVDHLQRWSRIFRSKETEMVLSIWIPTEIPGIFGKMERTHYSTNDILNYTTQSKLNLWIKVVLWQKSYLSNLIHFET